MVLIGAFGADDVMSVEPSYIGLMLLYKRDPTELPSPFHHARIHLRACDTDHADPLTSDFQPPEL